MEADFSFARHHDATYGGCSILHRQETVPTHELKMMTHPHFGHLLIAFAVFGYKLSIQPVFLSRIRL